MKTVKITLSNSAGALDSATVRCCEDDNDADRRLGEAVIEMIRQSGNMLAIGDTISLTEVEG